MQWIDEADAVFRGGGVKGLALAGALCGFAEHPTKPVRTWKSVAGASAGAIIACYLATGHDAEEMLELMQKTSFGQFADFPGHNKELGIARLLAEHGMAPGKAFERWFDDVLERRDLRQGPEATGTGTGRGVVVEAHRRGRHRGPPARPPRRPAALPRPGHGHADRPRRVPDRAGGSDEHVDPVLLRSGRAAGRAGPDLPDRRRRDALELPGLALGRRPEGHAATTRRGRRSASRSPAATASALRASSPRSRRGTSASRSTSSTPRSRPGTSASSRTRPASARSRSTPTTSGRPTSTCPRRSRSCSCTTAGKRRRHSSTPSRSSTTRTRTTPGSRRAPPQVLLPRASRA